MPHRPFRLPLSAAAAAIGAVVLTSVGAAADDSPDGFDASTIKASSHRFGDAKPHPGARTVPLWTGHTTNPDDGVTYTYSIVGADPATNGASTIQVDIVPVNVSLRGQDFNGSDAVAGVLASPLFQTADYSTTSAATNRSGGQGSGGQLSEGNAGVQLLDATMRSQFNKVGSSYHLFLAKPIVHRAVTLDAPASAGITPTSHGATYAVIDEAWFQPQAEALNTTLSYLHPYRLALFVTKNVVLFADHNPAHCCVLGAHGAVDTTRNNGNGRQSIQTFAWSSWLTAGFFNPAMHWAGQDINALSHEVTEWAVDPFGTNPTQPWFSPIAPQYGCSELLETGDPTLNVGFSVGVNAFDQNPFTDGTYHPQDEAFLPWFMHTAPNTVSEPAQSGSGGRYTFLGDLNPFPFFHGPAPTC